MSYLDWNNRLAQKFFNEEMAGREVLLYATKEIINEIGSGFGNVNDFVHCVQDEGPPWTTRSGICQKALQAYENWRRRNLEYPPYIAFLALFVLSEDVEGDFASHAYYPRLWTLLGQPEERGPLPSFNRMWKLWDDLEKWSKEDKNEELGRFTARIRGDMMHIGLPLSQTLLSHKERSDLPVIFSEAELDPTDIPAVDAVKDILLQYGRPGHLLERRTLRLLEASDDENRQMRNALLELVLDELADWDGLVPEIESPDTIHAREAKTGLRLCMEIDSLAGTIKTFLRFKTNRTIPDEGLNFKKAGSEKILTCFEAIPYWSSRLKDQTTARPFDSSSIDWRTDLKLKDPENNWTANLKDADVRLFIPGKREGLPENWIESHHLDRHGEFMIAAYSGMKEIIKEWGLQYCENFQEKSYSGSPPGWTLFYIKNATKSCFGVDILTLSDLLRIRLEGGIKTGRGNTFLKFGLPSIKLENMSGNETVKIDGVDILRDDENIPIWKLRGEYPLSEPIRIEVFRDGSEPLQTRIIKIEDPKIPFSFDDVPRRGPDGKIIEHGGSGCYAVGSIVTGTKEEHAVFSTALPTHLASRIIFLGSKPGEIRDWPGEGLPAEWHPVWAIAKEGHKQWVVHFCGNAEHLGERHTPGNPLSDRRAVKRWKEAIWIYRKICQQPALLTLSRIWKKYLEVARNA